MTTLSLTDPVNNTVADAATIASNNAAIKTAFNGNIDNTNIATSPAIDSSKIKGTLVKLNDTSLGAGAASIDITGLSTAYAHMLIVAYLRGDTAAANAAVNIRFNNDSGTNYDYAFNDLFANNAAGPGGGAAGTAGNAGRMPANTAPASAFGCFEILISNYASTAGHKHYVFNSSSREGTAANTFNFRQGAGVWFATPAAINRVTLITGAGNFVTNSRVTIYAMGV